MEPVIAQEVTFFDSWKARLFLGSSFGRHVGLAMGTNVIIAGLGLGTGLLTARLLGPEGRGEFAAIQTWPTVLAGFAMLGLDTSVVYWSSRNRQNGARYLASALAMIGVSGAVAIAAGWMLMPALLAAQSPTVVRMARIYLLMVPVYALVGMPHQMLRAAGAWRAWNVTRVLPNSCWLIALLIIRYGVPGWATPPRLSVLFLANSFWLAIPVFVIVRRHLPGPFQVERRLFSPLLRYGVPDVLSSLPRTLNQRLDQLLMVAFLDARLLGLYVVAVAWSGAVIPLLSAVGPVLFPTLSASVDAGERRRRLGRVIRLTVCGAGGMTVLVLAVTPAMIPLLFGHAYAAAVPAALVLVVASGINGVNLTLADALRGLGRPQSILASEAVGLVVTCVLLLVLLRPFGLMGAAVASLVAYGVVCAALTLAIRRKTTGRPRFSIQNFDEQPGDIMFLNNSVAAAPGAGRP